MGEFFKGWRRKTGCVTLVMACVFMGGWIRSLSNTDIVKFARGGYATDLFYSFDGSLIWVKVFQDCPDVDLSLPEWDMVSKRKEEYDFFNNDRITWFSKVAGIGIGKVYDRCTDRIETFVFIPYWSIVLPLTALSAFLLLKKPKSSTVKKIIEPIANERPLGSEISR